MSSWSRLLIATALAAIALPASARPSVAAAAAEPPAQFTANPRVGPGGTRFKDSPHFRIYGATNDAVADGAIAMLEAAYTCFVEDLGWRSPGLSFRNFESTNGPWNKLNVYQLDTLPGAAANTPTDLNLGLAWLNVVKTYMTEPSVVVHEFGHALTYAAGPPGWIDQTRTGAWWETTANFVADMYLTSSKCASARAKFNQKEGNTLIDFKKSISDSFQVIVDGTRDTGNYYQAWPFFVYLFNNLDNTTANIFPQVWTQYKKGSDETPLHVMERIIAPVKIQTVVARYWARMAFVDIGHPKAQAAFNNQRKNLNYANLDSQGSGRYRVKSARRPRYMGANITPLKGTGNIVANVTADRPFTATLAIKAANGAVRYVDMPGGNGQANVANGEEAMLVVVNTPANLILFDPFKLTAEANTGVDYQVQLTGATV
ncbi:hypothetical protein B0T16DRAFT_391852 [Cercophora newfieldiana]|uniref:Uncharacterized protein n=1 Tax=Cercophora newfieldiana TaxID=92897 RepID=A0AA40CLW4_9PEZI|nr:hypothetical protein B0T16DRAFT_391852 [Cercophora newfieldiana]